MKGGLPPLLPKAPISYLVTYNFLGSICTVSPPQALKPTLIYARARTHTHIHTYIPVYIIYTTGGYRSIPWKVAVAVVSAVAGLAAAVLVVYDAH